MKEKETEQIEVFKEELRKVKKAMQVSKERESKLEMKIKEIGRSYQEMEENYKKEIELLRGSNRKIKVELEQTKVCNVKL